MPPKKQTKTEKDKKAKKVEDKTFGMKNKNKSAKVQRFVQQVQAQAKHNDELGRSTVCDFILTNTQTRTRTHTSTHCFKMKKKKKLFFFSFYCF
jgi:NH3-dependent NAD+ synthetase